MLRGVMEAQAVLAESDLVADPDLDVADPEMAERVSRLAMFSFIAGCFPWH